MYFNDSRFTRKSTRRNRRRRDGIPPFLPSYFQGKASARRISPKSRVVRERWKRHATFNRPRRRVAALSSKSEATRRSHDVNSIRRYSVEFPVTRKNSTDGHGARRRFVDTSCAVPFRIVNTLYADAAAARCETRVAGVRQNAVTVLKKQ